MGGREKNAARATARKSTLTTTSSACSSKKDKQPNDAIVILLALHHAVSYAKRVLTGTQKSRKYTLYFIYLRLKLKYADSRSNAEMSNN